MLGCGNPQSEKPLSENPPPDTAPVADVEVIDHVRLQEIINNRADKVLFINVWATWCAPCVAEFPDLVKLKDHFGDSIDLISLSVDHPSEIQDLVIPFMANHKVNFPVYVIDDNYSEDIIELLNLHWSGAIPASFIYDTEGRQTSFILGANSFRYFKSSVDSVKTL